MAGEYTYINVSDGAFDLLLLAVAILHHASLIFVTITFNP
jgi:hypothetical protein